MIKTTGNIAASANIVKESVVMGDVSIGADSTILFYAVLRGDDNKIIIGKGTNIQDNCTVHTSKVKRECTFLYRRGKETQGRRLLPVKKRYTSG